MSQRSLPLETLLLVCVHGFKGTDSTFENFPDRLAYTLSHTFHGEKDALKVERIVYPRYRTAGELHEAVTNFVSWLVTLVGDRESESGKKGSVGVILMGHSMGGLVCADSVLGLSKAYERGKAPLWPRVIGIIAYDTPYLGVNPNTFKASIEQVVDYGNQAYSVATAVGAGIGYFSAKKGGGDAKKPAATANVPPAAAPSSALSTSDANASAASTTSSASWLRTAGAAAGGSVAAAAAGAALWLTRDAISQYATLGWTGTQEHLTYVGELWKQDELTRRLDLIVDLDEKGQQGQQEPGTGFKNRVGFHCFYTMMPSGTNRARTFIVLPAPSKTVVLGHFTANGNSKAATEVDAHVSMFSVKSDGNHDLALRSTQLITDWITASEKQAEAS